MSDLKASNDKSSSENNKNRVLVIGGGVTGLQTALSLAKSESPKYDVVVISKEYPGVTDPYYTSPWAGGHWRTHAGPEDHEQQEWDTETYKYWQSLIEKTDVKTCGVKLTPITCYWDEPDVETADNAAAIWWKTVVSDFKIIDKAELPENTDFGVTFTSFCINVPAYLQYLVSELKAAGIPLLNVEIPKKSGINDFVASALQIAAESHGKFGTVVNATGLAAHRLVPDESVYPARGQTLLAKGEVTQGAFRQGKGYISYVIPRPGSGTTILGGSKDVNDWNVKVDEELSAKILARCKLLKPDLPEKEGEHEIISAQVGLRPGRKGGARVEVEPILVDGEPLRLVHSYGHGGAGYQNSYGSAQKVLGLLASS